MIPKKLHYCWFGGSEMPKHAIASTERWAELMPEYEIVRWDESNFDIDSCRFVRQAYDAGRWAFVSDYARFRIVFEHGGVYMDIGSDLLRNLDPLVSAGAFSGREWETRFVSPGLVLAAESGNPLLEKTLLAYEEIEFEDTWAFMGRHTVNNMFAKVLYPLGYTNDEDVLWRGQGFTVYPSDFFSPKLSFGGFRTTDNTYATHRGSASWAPESERFRISFINKWAPRVGDFMARKAARLLAIAIYRRRR